MKIAVDVMSGDFPPEILIEGAVNAINEYKIPLVLVGKEERIKKHLKNLKFDSSLLEIYNADEVITMNDDPVRAFKTKPDASVVRCAELARNGKVDAFFSPGNTGATLTAALMMTGRLKGIERPAIASVIPTINNTPLVVLDMGATLECKPLNYLQFAIMGRVMVQNLFGIEHPKIGLLNVGEEPYKGPPVLKKVFDELKRLDINFQGNIESKEILEGKVNVVVTDGFTGNIFLKSVEGTFKSLLKLTKREINKSIFFQTGALLMKTALDNIKKILSSEEYGAAPLLGVNSVCMIGHGNSRQTDIKNGIKMTVKFIQNRINESIVEEIRRTHLAKFQYPFLHIHPSETEA